MPISNPALPSVRPTGRVLIVDDNAELVETLRAVIASGVTRARRSRPPRTALPRWPMAEKGFDVAIVDVKLPDVSGIDLIQPLRVASPLSEVLLLTGFASVDAAIGALRSGAFAFVLKSFRPEELISTVEQALGKVQLKREREELERRYRDLVEVTDVLVVRARRRRRGRADEPQGGRDREHRGRSGDRAAVPRVVDPGRGPRA